MMDLRHLVIEFDKKDINAQVAMVMLKALEELEVLETQLSDPDVPLPTESAEQYIWIRDTIAALKELRQEAVDSARNAFLRVMSDKRAIDTYKSIKKRCPGTDK
ncbi:MAG: hypothetical protein GF414_01560 [Candidatus Altiarchaeales archaeon]|nr:hypothetical protein [Candidatus Altiarchaeales archaeon]